MELNFSPKTMHARGVIRASARDTIRAAVFSATVFASGIAIAQGEARHGLPPGIMAAVIMITNDSDTAGTIDRIGPFVEDLPQNRIEVAIDFPAGAKNDRSTRIFKLGLDYFKNADYPKALREFRRADSPDTKPLYRLFIGKTLHQLGQSEKMVPILQAIVKNNPRCDVADDALYDMAVYYQTIDDYSAASRYYTKIVNEYPWGKSYSTSEKFSDFARDQRAFIRAEMSNKLAILGYTHENLDENFRAFQRNHNLEVTGTGDQPTVTAIKKAYGMKLLREQQNADDGKRARRYLLWAGVVATAAFLNLAVSAIIFFNLRGKQRLLAQLEKTIAGLDTRNL